MRSSGGILWNGVKAAESCMQHPNFWNIFIKEHPRTRTSSHLTIIVQRAPNSFQTGFGRSVNGFNSSRIHKPSRLRDENLKDSNVAAVVCYMMQTIDAGDRIED